MISSVHLSYVLSRCCARGMSQASRFSSLRPLYFGVCLDISSNIPRRHICCTLFDKINDADNAKLSCLKCSLHFSCVLLVQCRFSSQVVVSSTHVPFVLSTSTRSTKAVVPPSPPANTPHLRPLQALVEHFPVHRPHALVDLVDRDLSS